VKFSTAVVENNPPELFILTIDFWWFNKNRNNPKRPLEGTLSSFDLKKAIHFWNILISDGLPNVSGLINTTPMKSDISGLNV
ncbi:hypothetical protein SB659_20255, partial [Arthrobacter sp. SIMBA_036]|uniref:hypothetical protein n=1 Tax=Arthrobacter sp. SIMBA_036 TaxID=3085778 RepID=UPI00397E4AF4